MLTQLLFTPEITAPVTHYFIYWLIGVVAFPISVGVAGRLAGKRIKTEPMRMAILSFIWPVAIWGIVASTIADNISQS